jgi:TolB-like protein/Tfp pilus assembly protein PilF
LAENQGRLVSKEELIGAVWAEAFVTDNSLVQCLIEIRRAMGDEGQAFIRTVPRRGYIFDAATTARATVASAHVPSVEQQSRAYVRWLGLAVAGIALLTAVVLLLAHTRKPPASGATSPKFQSIAVLPLINLSRDPDQEFFAEGMTEALITNLGKSNSLRVISHTSVNHFKGSKLSLPQIAQELKVDAVVEGTVMRAGDHLRVTANLIQAFPEKHLWADAYQRDLRDVLAMQDEIAAKISGEVQANSSHRQPAVSRPVNPEAYQEYLWGRRLFEGFTWDGEHNALGHLDRAIRLDPNFAPAYATRAEAYIPLVAWGAIPPRESLAKAEADARKALSLDGTLADAHIGMAGVHVMRTEWAEAEQEFQRALALNPSHYLAHDWHGYLLGDIGNHDAEMAEIKLSCQLDPVTEFPHKSLGAVHLETGRYAEAISEAQKALELSPAFGDARWVLARAYEEQGQYTAAIAEFQKLNDSVDLGHAYAVSGDKAKARAMLRALELQAKTQYMAHRGFALVWLGLGEQDKAIVELEKADHDGEPFDYMNQDNRFTPLRKNSRYLALLRRHGLKAG